MVRQQIQARGITDARVLAAMAAVPRHLFISAQQRSLAYGDHPLPIGPGQTISQPYIVAFMAEALGLRGFERVLEVGSGCGYFAAVLALLVKDVCGVELDPGLAEDSQRRLEGLGYDNVRIRCGDGAEGWPERAPFDAIVLSCAADALPAALSTQLAADGVAMFPENRGWGAQQLVRQRRRDGQTILEDLLPVAFVPLRRPSCA
jgi:protein-L-isoaspartate(D-aspartate) O-methyltransferase